MAKQIINIGQSVNDKSGDPLRTAFNKINQNFTELYTLTSGNGDDLQELAQDYASTMFVHAGHTGITFAYDDENGKIIAVVLDNDSIYVTNSTLTSTLSSYATLTSLQNLLPSQSGNSGKFLSNNGTGTLSWENIEQHNVTSSATVPLNPANQDLWYDTAGGRMYIYFDNTWVDTNPETLPNLSAYALTSDLPTDISDLTDNTNLLSGNGFSVVTAPTHSYGQAGDTIGDIAFNSSHFYYCTATFTGAINTNTISWSDPTEVTNGDGHYITATLLPLIASQLSTGTLKITNIDNGSLITSNVTNYDSLGNDIYRFFIDASEPWILSGTSNLTVSIPVSIWKRIQWSNDTW